MCKATIELISPNGVPVTLEVSKEDDPQAIIGTLERAEKIGVYFGSRGWAFAHAETLGPSVGELAQGPTFAGYPCSQTTDERGCRRGSSWREAGRSGGRSRAMRGTVCGRRMGPMRRRYGFRREKSRRR